MKIKLVSFLKVGKGMEEEEVKEFQQEFIKGLRSPFYFMEGEVNDDIIHRIYFLLRLLDKETIGLNTSLDIPAEEKAHPKIKGIYEYSNTEEVIISIGVGDLKSSIETAIKDKNSAYAICSKSTGWVIQQDLPEMMEFIYEKLKEKYELN